MKLLARAESSTWIFVLLMLGITVKGAGSSYFLAYQSLIMEARGWPHSLNGTAHALQLGVTVFVALAIPWLLRHMSLVVGLLAAAGVTILGLHMTWAALQADALSTLAYMASRIVIGIGIGASYLLGETWLNSLTKEKNRATLLSVYGACLGGGLGVGPLFLNLTGSEGYLPTAITASTIAFMGFSALVVYRHVPHLPYLPMGKALRSLFLSPTALTTAICFGIMDACILTLAPLFGLEVGLSQSDALALVLYGNLGAVVLIIPLGWLADRTHKRKLLAYCSLGAALCTATIPLFSDAFALSLIFFIWGGCFAMFYILALAMLGSHFQHDHLALASMTVILMYGIGSLIGPAMGGWAMDLFGAVGLPALLTLCSLLCLGITLARMTRETLR
jgi:MFS family permease